MCKNALAWLAANLSGIKMYCIVLSSTMCLYFILTEKFHSTYLMGLSLKQIVCRTCNQALNELFA